MAWFTAWQYPSAPMPHLNFVHLALLARYCSDGVPGWTVHSRCHLQLLRCFSNAQNLQRHRRTGNGQWGWQEWRSGLHRCQVLTSSPCVREAAFEVGNAGVGSQWAYSRGRQLRQRTTGLALPGGAGWTRCSDAMGVKHVQHPPPGSWGRQPGPEAVQLQRPVSKPRSAPCAMATRSRLRRTSDAMHARQQLASTARTASLALLDAMRSALASS